MQGNEHIQRFQGFGVDILGRHYSAHHRIMLVLATPNFYWAIDVLQTGDKLENVGFGKHAISHHRIVL